MASDRVAIVVQHAPSRHPREAVDMALALVSVDRPVAVFLSGEGPLHLLAGQAPDALALAPAHALWRQVLEFGGALYACAGSLRDLGIAAADLDPEPEILDPRELQAALFECDAIANG